MAERRIGVVGAGGRIGGVDAVAAVHVVEVLRLRVVGLEVLVAERPGGRDAVRMGELAEVLLAQAKQRRAVELGVAAHVIVDAGVERPPSPSCQSSRARYLFSMNTARESQLSFSRGSHGPRSSSRMRFPEGARRYASVPPPAPLLMMMTS